MEAVVKPVIRGQSTRVGVDLEHWGSGSHYVGVGVVRDESRCRYLWLQVGRYAKQFYLAEFS